MSDPTPSPGTPFTSVASAENPWPGLLSFREADQRWFQGRRDETAELLRYVRQERLTVVFALSGIGKSSLLQAGLFPALRAGDLFPVYIRLDHTGRSGDLASQVFDAIAQAGAAADIKVPAVKAGETLWEYFHNVQSTFSNKNRRPVLPVLVFDQFEEIFTLGKSEGRSNISETFLADLADLADDTVPAAVAQRWDANPADRDDYSTDGEYKLLISLREDFLPELSDQRRRIALVPQKRYRLRQMTGEGALLAVSQAKDIVDEAVAAQIVRFVSAGDSGNLGRRALPLKDLEVEPALLSVVCAELNDRRRQRGERKISADLLEGSSEAILNDFYERSFQGLAPAVSTFVEEKLITVGGARNSVSLEDALAEPGMNAEITEKLVSRRLLRKEFRRNEVRLELTHDLLTGVVRNNRDKRRNAEALALQEEKERKARAEAARNRKLATAFGAIAIVALIAAIFAGIKTVAATRATSEANAATARATTALSNERVARDNEAKQRQIADDKSIEAQRNLIMANTNLTEAEKQKAIATLNADEARRQAEDARNQKQAADKNATEANNQKELANKNADEAKRQEELAKLSAAEAKKQEDIATLRANEVAAAKALEDKENAKELVKDAVNAVAAKQAEKALGDVARALTLDPDSVAARSLALDQLLRSSISHLAATGTNLYVHAPIILPKRVLFAVYSPDRRYIATSSDDNTVRLWDAASGQSAGELSGHNPPVYTVAFSEDSKRLVTSSIDQTARVWDVATKQQLFELRHGARVTSASFSKDGRIVTSSQDKTAQIWDAKGTKVGNPMVHPMTVNFASFSPDGQYVITACADQNARIWRVGATGPAAEPKLTRLHQGEVRTAMFSPDGKYVVTASSDHFARVFTADEGELVGEPMQHNAAVYFATFSPDGKRIATASLDESARVWDARTGSQIAAPLAHNNQVLSVEFSPDGNRVITASADGARIWEVYHDFDKVDDLVKLLESLGGFSADENSPALPPAERKKLMDEVDADTKQPVGSTAQLIRWFLSHRS